MGLEGRLAEAESRTVPAILWRLLSASARNAISTSLLVASFVGGSDESNSRKSLASFAGFWAIVEVCVMCVLASVRVCDLAWYRVLAYVRVPLSMCTPVFPYVCACT